MKRFAIFTALILSVALFSSACTSSAEQPQTVSTPTPQTSEQTAASTPTQRQIGIREGDLAPDFELASLDGTRHRLSDFRGKVVFLNFWATWCPPCRAEMPSMEAMYQDLKDEGFVVLAVSVGEGAGVVEDFIEEYGLTFPVYLDGSKSVYKEYNRSSGIPQTYIIDREGVVRFYIPGSRDWSTLGNRAVVRELLLEGE